MKLVELSPLYEDSARRIQTRMEELRLRLRTTDAPDSVRRLCDAVSHTCGGRCAVFSGEGERYQYAVIHPGADLREFVKHMNDALHGRGGGRSGFAQGSVAADEEAIRAFFRGV